MLSYQHGFHAGNKADVLKHAVLDALLRDLTAGKRSRFYVETHSGRGIYDLTGDQANKTGEAAEGVLEMLEDSRPPKPLRPWLDDVRTDTAQAYRGSPAIAVRRLKPTDRLVLFERHPAEHAALSDALADDKRIRIQKADGYTGALKLQPRRGEDMIILVDPSYETMRDMDELAQWAPRALNKWPNAVLILWLPLFKDEREAEFGAFLSELEDGVIAGARWAPDLEKDTALCGSAMVAYRVSDETKNAATEIASALQSYWSSGKRSSPI